MTTQEKITSLEGIIKRLKASLPKEHEPSPPVTSKLAEDICGFRYFESGGIYWKMPPTGSGFIRHYGQLKWIKSPCDISYFADYSDKEVTAEEAEPEN